MQGIRAQALLVFALVGLSVVLVFSAFQSDDAFITFRTVQNAWQGRGLTWNPGERVQAYTHPAWMVLALLCYGVSGECFFSVLTLAIVLMIVTALLLANRGPQQLVWGATLVVLLSTSLAVVNYGVCGLENPLLFLLLTCFVIVARQATERSPLSSSLLVAGILLTRQDALLLVGPAYLVVSLPHLRAPGTLARSLLGLSPLLLWEAFSLVYYGALVPNTALAKLNVALPMGALAGQGGRYFLDSLCTDPITLVLTVGCTILLVRRRAALERAFALGVALYFVYVLCIGGDFMSGRFFGAPLVLALCAVATAPDLVLTASVQKVALLVSLLYGIAWPRSPLHLDYSYGVGWAFADAVRTSGIADERGYYYPTTGLLRVMIGLEQIRRADLTVPPYRGALRGRAFARSDKPLAIEREVGFFGYFAGEKSVLDRWALTDPLLARIPFRATDGFRVGHYERALPEGYVQSRLTGKNLLVDPELSHLYDLVQRVVKGPLFTKERLLAISELHGLAW